MTLEQLRIFVAVAERQHVTRAAAALNLTQSAVSGAIQALERRHGVTLFHRIGRRIEITRDGEQFLDEAQAVLRQARSAEQTLKDLAGLERGVLHLHASQTIASYWLPRHLVRFKTAHPAIDIRLSIGNTAQVAEAVTRGTAELGFIEGRVDAPDLDATQITEDRLAVVVGARHPWTRVKRITPAQIISSPWILREQGSGTRSVFEAALAALGVSADSLTVILELPSNEAVCAAVEVGEAATALSLAVAQRRIAARRLHLVPFREMRRPFMILRHRGRRASRAGAAFAATIAAAG